MADEIKRFTTLMPMRLFDRVSEVAKVGMTTPSQIVRQALLHELVKLEREQRAMNRQAAA